MKKDNHHLPIIKFKMFLVMVIFLLIPRLAIAYDVICGGLALSTVQACADTVVSKGGGNVFLPAGTATWSGSLYIPGGVNIIGAGSPMTTKGSNNKWTPEPTTIITVSGNTAINVNESGHTQSYTSVRIANIKFTNTASNGAFVALRNNPDSRVDHCIFQGNESLGASMYQLLMDSKWSDPITPTTGVVDHCNFAWGDYGVHVGPRLMSTLVGLGSGSAVFVEDCYLENFGHPISGLNGAHWVFRYNYQTSIKSKGGWGYGIDAHGPVFEDLGGAGAGQYRGTQYTETYNNYLTSDTGVNGGQDNWGALRLRSGQGVIFNNTFENHRHAVIFTEDSYSCSHAGIDAPHNYYFWNNTLSNISEQVIWNDSLGCTPTYITLTTSCNPLPSNSICTNNTTSMPGYTPYTYPHPLTKPVPYSPKNLRIINP